MKVKDAAVVKGLSGFYYDDQMAIRGGAKQDGMVYLGEPKTGGFKTIRQPAESASIMLLLDNGRVAFGDCVSNQYSGVGGRDRFFDAHEHIPFIEENILPRLKNLELTDFRSLAVTFDNLEIKGERMPASIRYGVSQALLDAVAQSQSRTMSEVVAEEYGLEIATVECPIYAQTGDDRYLNVDKMIMKKVDIIPHGLFNSYEKLGIKGATLRKYLGWLKERIEKLGSRAIGR